jgi:acyl dehydratase
VSWLLYALGVGAEPPRDLALLFEGHGPVVAPTFATVPTSTGYMPMIAELGLGLGDVLHAGQELVLHRPLRPRGSATVTRRISNIWDKGSRTILVVDDEGHDDDGPLFTTRSSWFVSRRLGVGSERGPSAADSPVPPARPPDVSTRRTVRANLPAVFRLSGDLNPIHIDPVSAREAGFDGTFIHGLCTFGMVALDLLMEMCSGDAAQVRSIAARFVAPVRAGDILVLEMWRAEDLVHLRASTAERVVLSGGIARLLNPDR